MSAMRGLTLAFAAAMCAGAFAAPKCDLSDPDVAERFIQCYNGEIQILPALTKDEIPKGHVEGVKAVGGFSFDFEWEENKMTWMRVRSEKGGVCRIRSYAGIGSPLLRKATKTCPNPDIAATQDLARRPTTPESVFDRAKPLSSVCYDFDTEPGEALEFRGVTGNQDWTDYSATLSESFLKSSEGRRIAKNVLAYQLDTGGWPKNVPMQDKLSPKEMEKVLSFKSEKKRGTIDNFATFTEINFLARMYKATGEKEYLDGAVKGIGFLLYLQYPNGGWPQCDPAKVGYWHQITYNDGAMINVMKVMRNVYEAKGLFDMPIPEETRKECRKAFVKGLGCILRTQIVQNGKLTLWCQQHDRETLEPCIGRAFELPSICTMESADILSFLMELNLDEYPEPLVKRIKRSLAEAVEWYRANAIKGIKIEHGWRREDGIKTSRLVRVPEDETEPMWCRYYTLEDNRPFTGRRDSTMNFDFSEMERGENMNYMWFNTRGTWVEKAYEKWLVKEERRLARAEKRKTAKTTEWKGGKGSGGRPYIQQEKDVWENPANWSNGVPDTEDTVVFAKDATIWSLERNRYECAKTILANGAKIAFRSNYEANSAANPGLRTGAIEGSGTIFLSRAGLESREGETLVVPESVSVVADPKEGRGSWLAAPGRGRMIVKGDVSCPGNKLSIMGDVTIEKELPDIARIDLGRDVKLAHPPKYEPVTIDVAPPMTISEAIAKIPENSPVEHIIKVAPGKYREKVRISGRRSNVKMIATDPDPANTVISWNDTPSTPGPDGKELGTFGSYTLYVDIPDFEMSGFTIENTGTPERLAATGGKEQAGQCVALFVAGDRCAFRNCRMLGWQDTLYAGGKYGASPARQYFEDCYIEGTVDFIFGGAVALFNRCRLHSVDGGYVTAGNHAEDMKFGYVFYKCGVTCAEGKKTSLGRPWRPFANVMFVGSDFGDAVTAQGWNDWTTDDGRRVWRSAEYACTQKGEVKRDPIVKVGGAKELKEHLAANGVTSIADIIAGDDGWHPMKPAKTTKGRCK